MLFFFFQAEDGIRDTSVTGVQTCALPISKTGVPARVPWVRIPPCPLRVRQLSRRSPSTTTHSTRPTPAPRTGSALARSEERRVGKECRSRWWWDHEKKKRIDKATRSDAM